MGRSRKGIVTSPTRDEEEVDSQISSRIWEWVPRCGLDILITDGIPLQLSLLMTGLVIARPAVTHKCSSVLVGRRMWVWDSLDRPFRESSWVWPIYVPQKLPFLRLHVFIPGLQLHHFLYRSSSAESIKQYSLVDQSYILYTPYIML